MSIIRKNNKRKNRRARRVRDHISTVSTRPRVAVFKSARHIYAQLIDGGVTHVSCSTLELDAKALPKGKKEQAHEVGVQLAKKAVEKGFGAIAFDRGRFLYHGRVKELAQGLRDGGLQF